MADACSSCSTYRGAWEWVSGVHAHHGRCPRCQVGGRMRVRSAKRRSSWSRRRRGPGRTLFWFRKASRWEDAPRAWERRRAWAVGYAGRRFMPTLVAPLV